MLYFLKYPLFVNNTHIVRNNSVSDLLKTLNSNSSSLSSSSYISWNSARLIFYYGLRLNSSPMDYNTNEPFFYYSLLFTIKCEKLVN